MDAVWGYNYKIAVAQWFDNIIMFAVVWSVLSLELCPRGPSWRVCSGGTATRPTPQYWLKIYTEQRYLDMRNYSVTDAL